MKVLLEIAQHSASSLPFEMRTGRTPKNKDHIFSSKALREKIHGHSDRYEFFVATDIGPQRETHRRLV